MPDGQLTPVQFEIMEAVWAAGSSGATVAQIWQIIAARRAVARTTILNLVDRLEKREWLRRADSEEGVRFLACVARDVAAANLAGDFVSDFFGGSMSSLVMSLLGSQKLDAAEVQRLRSLLNEASEKPLNAATRRPRTGQTEVEGDA